MGNALKGGKKAMNKMETRIRELESEVDAEARRCGDAHKNLRKSERRIKEMTYASDEDRKNHERMQALIDQLQARSSLTRSRLRKPRRSPPSTWPSTGRPRTASPTPPSVRTRTSRPSPRTVLGPAAPPSDLCKWKTQYSAQGVDI